MFFDLFVTSFTGIVTVLCIGLFSVAIVDGFKVRQSFLNALSALFIRIALPCLIFSNMVTQFRPKEVDHWWIFPLLAIGLFAGGGILAYLYTKLDRSVKHRELFTSSVAFHNSIMLPLAIAPVLFAGERLAHFLSLLFLYNLLAVPAFFTVGIWMMHSASGGKRSVWNYINPPNIATITGIFIALTGNHDKVPVWLIDPMRMFGTLCTPLSMMIVGGIILASIPQARGDDWAEPLKITLLKSFILPLITIAGIYIVHPPEDIALFLVLGSTMPVGSTLAAICPNDSSMQKHIAGGILLTSIAAILAVSVFMSMFTMMYR